MGPEGSSRWCSALPMTLDSSSTPCGRGGGRPADLVSPVLLQELPPSRGWGSKHAPLLGSGSHWLLDPPLSSALPPGVESRNFVTPITCIGQVRVVQSRFLHEVMMQKDGGNNGFGMRWAVEASLHPRAGPGSRRHVGCALSSAAGALSLSQAQSIVGVPLSAPFQGGGSRCRGARGTRGARPASQWEAVLGPAVPGPWPHKSV